MLLQAAMQVCETSSLFRYLLHENQSLRFFTKSQHSVHVCSCSNFTHPPSMLLYQAIHICYCPLISQPANIATLQHVPHIHNIQATDYLRLSTERCCHFVPCPDEVDHRTSHSEKKLPLQDDDVPTTLHVTHPLRYTQSGQESQMHMVTSRWHINFLFHTPWNFT
jgi:hypothetical protein